MKLILKIAFRFLTSSKIQTLLIILGISIGVSVQIFIGALIQGLQLSLVQTTIGSSSQITIKSNSDDKTIKNWDRTIFETKLSSDQIKNISIAKDKSGFINYKDYDEPILLRGFSIEDADRIYKITPSIYLGSDSLKDYQCFMGRDLAEKLKISIGERVNVSFSDGTNSNIKVVGFYDLKVSSINKSWIIINQNTSDDLLNLDNKVTSIEMQVTQVFAADEIATLVQDNISNPDLIVENWKSQNAQLLSGLNGQSASSYMIQIFVIIAVTLGISSVLAVSVVQKSKQIGILKAMGINDSLASGIFLFQGIFLGIIGGIIGTAFGIGLLYSFSKFALNPEGKPIIPVQINTGFLIFSAGIAIFSATLAAIIPAKLSNKLNPIEVIRNG